MTPKALIFDVFGTCVDWRSSVAREVSKVLKTVDSLAFADAWRAEYDPAMARIRDGGRGYVALDDLHRENLERILLKFDASLTDAEIADLNTAWEKLDPWPDTVAGLHSLRDIGLIAPCSNGSIALMSRLARYAGLPWDCILGAEIAKDYKPSPVVYQASCAALRLSPEEVMFVAAHNSDLHAAAACGLQTAFILRPTEHGPNQTTDLAPDGDWDFVATGFDDLAGQLVAQA